MCVLKTQNVIHKFLTEYSWFECNVFFLLDWLQHKVKLLSLPLLFTTAKENRLIKFLFLGH